MNQPPLWLLTYLTKAMLVAEAAGAKEIGVEHLSAAVESAPGEDAPAEARSGPFIPVPKRDMMLSAELRAFLESLGDFQRISIADLQRALRARK
jgi:hypothetical protein